MGRSEKSGASTISVSKHEAAGDQRGDRRPRSRRLVQRARRQARRDRHPLEHARRRRSPSPARPTPGSRRCGSGGASRTPARRRRSARTRSAAARPRRCRSSTKCRRTSSQSGQRRARQPARHVADERDPVRAEVEQRTMRAARRRRARARPGRPARRTAARGSPPSADDARRAASSSGSSPRPPSHVRARARRCRRRVDVPVSFGSSPIDDVDRSAGEEAGDRPPSRGTARSSPSGTAPAAGTARPVTSVIAATSCAASVAAEPVDEHGAARDRGERRARPRRDLPRGAEERVDDRAGRRGVEPVLAAARPRSPRSRGSSARSAP